MKQTTFAATMNDNGENVTLLSGWPSAPINCATALVLVDQLTKLAATTAQCGTVICPLRNEALFLGIGAGSNVDVVTMTAFGLGVFILWVRAARRRGHVPRVAVALVMAGILSNMLDRLTTGAVRDFLAVPGGVVINLADLGVIGGLLACAVMAAAASRARSNSGRG